MSGFGDCPLFEVDMGSGARYYWEFLIVFECCFGRVFQEPILEPVDVGRKGIFWRRVGFCSSTLLYLGLASDFLCVLVKGMHCIAISAMAGIVAVGFRKALGSIPTSMHAALLKYRRWIFWHMYRACLVVFLWTMNSTGNQP